MFGIRSIALNKIVQAIQDFSKYLTLRLKGDSYSKNGNAFFTDASSALAVVSNPNTALQTSFSPYLPNWSYKFNGSSHLLYSNAALSVGSGSFTLECWVNPTTADMSSATNIFAAGIGDYASGSNFIAVKSNNNTVGVFYQAGAASGSITVAASAGKWYHIAAVRSAGTLFVYVNGELAGSVAFAVTLASDSNVRIGAGDSLGAGIAAGFFSTSFISNVRLTNTAVYAAVFTPSATALTAVSGTLLLTLQNAYLKDNSTNNLTATQTGTVEALPFNPFTVADVPSPAPNSFFFPGGSSVNFGNNSVFAVGLGDFTIETWINFNSLTGTVPICQSDAVGSSASDKLWAGYDISVGLALLRHGGAGFASAPWTPTTGQWYHIALVRQSGTVKIFVDGISLTVNNPEALASVNFAQNGFTIGAVSTPIYLNGYMSSFRLTKSAVYTASFTPPTGPLQALANTVLLTALGTQFTDSSSGEIGATTTGSPRITGKVPFSNTPVGSIQLNGTNQYLTLPNNAGYQFGTGDFTIEAWVYLKAYQAGPIVDLRGASTANPYSFWIDESGFLSYYDGTIITSSIKIPLNTWAHVALSRQSGTLRLLANGIVGYSGAYTTSLNPTATAYIGGVPFSSPIYINGNIAGLRITKGVSLYNGAYTVPTSPPTAATETTMLLKFDNVGIADSSGVNNLSITGSPEISTGIKSVGTGSISLPTGAQLTLTPNTLFNFGTGDFTIEAWVRLNNATAAYRDVLFISNGVEAMLFGFGNSGFGSRFHASVRSSSTSFVYSTSFVQSAAVNTWTHVAFTRNNGVCRIFVGGVLQTVRNAAFTGAPVTSWTDTRDVNGVTVARVSNSAADTLNGYVDDLKVYNGYAKYITDFTPT